MYCSVDTAPFSSIPGAQALISASEMLSTVYPKISGSFLHYASALIQNSLATIPLTPNLNTAKQQLFTACQYAPHASPAELEQFGDSLLTGADGPLSNALYDLAYLSYAATTLYKPISDRITTKIQKTQKKKSGESITPTQGFPYSPSNNQYDQSSSLPNVPYTDFNQGLPQFTPGTPQFNQGPPQFTPSNDAQNNFNLPPFLQQSGLQLNLDEHQQSILQLIELAKSEFKNGSKEIAYTAMLAAIKELEKCQ